MKFWKTGKKMDRHGKLGMAYSICHIVLMFSFEKKNMLSATLTFAQTHDCDITEQYVDWGNNINFIFMRDQHSPPRLNNTLIGIITSTLSS